MNKILIAFASGLMLGVLFAPSKGKKTRKKLANMGIKLKGGYNHLTDKLSCKIDSIRHSVDEMSENAVESIDSRQFKMESRNV